MNVSFVVVSSLWGSPTGRTWRGVWSRPRVIRYPAHALIDSASVREGTSAVPVELRRLSEDGPRQIGQAVSALRQSNVAAFNVVVADGFRPVIVRKVDPLTKPIDVELTPLEAEKLDPERRLVRRGARRLRQAATEAGRFWPALVQDRRVQRILARDSSIRLP